MTDEQFIKRMKASGWDFKPGKQKFTRSNGKETVSLDFAKKHFLKGGVIYQPQLQLPLKISHE